MTKLSLDALKQRAEAIASEDLLATISGGTQNACHNNPDLKEREVIIESTGVKDKLIVPPVK